MVYKNEKVASENRFWESSFQHFLPIRRKIKLAWTQKERPGKQDHDVAGAKILLFVNLKHVLLY
jgi:hypothetical protein